MSYQPPLIGFKRLLNFGAYSIPATGGSIFIIAGVTTAYCMVSEWLAGKKKIAQSDGKQLVLTIMMLSTGLTAAQSCGTGSSSMPIEGGVDACAHCKMTISDLRFGSELVTKKGRTYKFDDLKCLLSYMADGTANKTEIEAFYLPDFGDEGQLLPAKNMHILHSEDLRSPMGGNCAAFKTLDDLARAQQKFPGTIVKWEELSK
jgi:copper chaperone NosL